ncbi:MAG: hypothetical protein H7099_18185 [Gemmatimonadaceae bacterium]|nr:hypothetical protein [Gemmatimonadaceae bacterium]
MTIILHRAAIFAFWTVVRFLLIIGIGLLYCEVRGIPFPERLGDDIRMLVYRVTPATTLGHVTALCMLWVRGGAAAIPSSKQAGMAAFVCAVFLDSAFLFGTPYTSGMVMRRPPQMACALVITLAIGLLWATKVQPVPVKPMANEPAPG